jgi:hypothetical protein
MTLRYGWENSRSAQYYFNLLESYSLFFFAPPKKNPKRRPLRRYFQNCYRVLKPVPKLRVAALLNLGAFVHLYWTKRVLVLAKTRNLALSGKCVTIQD